MCGICGFNWNDNSLVKDMCNAISHRGPDQKGFFYDTNMTLGHQRLSIIDLSEKGKQPLFNEDRSICIIFNGEIYNYEELRRDLELKGHRFSSGTDTETIIHLYEEYGPDCVKKLHGMFAFAIWDSKKKQLFMARDRLGKKPLFYFYDGEKFIFASEIKAVIQDKTIKRELNHQALNQIINYGYVLNDDTLLKNIKDLLPGHSLIFSNNKISINKYWDVRINVKNESLDYYVKRLRGLLEAAVEKRLMSDVPLGATLSGGIDSSSIVAIMSKLNNNPIKTFTTGFGFPSDEFKESKIVSDHCGTDHKEILLDFNDIDKNFIDIVWHYEIPFGKPSVLTTYFVAKEIKKYITVALIGDGADEIFAGYDRYAPIANKPENMKLSDKDVGSVLSTNFGYNNDKKLFFSDKVLDVKNKDFIEPFSFIKNNYRNNNKEGLNAALLFELKSIIPNIHLNRVDRMSMAHSVEMRVPFMDHELVEFCMTIPSRFKWHNNDKKFILQKAVSDLLPQKIVKRKKFPFGMPFKEYYKKNFSSIAENILLSDQTKKRGYIQQNNFEKILKKLKEQKNPEDDSLRQILFLTSLELWHRMFIG